MNKVERVQKLRALKEQMEQKLSALKEAKKQKKIVEQKNSLANLFEGELERAQIILAAKDVLDRLQKMAEGLAKMTAEDIMPISDNMKGVFGTEVAETFESVANEQLASALEAVRSAKEQLNTQVLRMEGKISAEEASAPSNDMMTGGDEGSEGGDDLDLGGDDLGGDEDLGGDDMGSDDLGGEEEDDAAQLDDLFGGDEAAAGPEGEPLGRAKKESVSAHGKVLSEAEEKEEEEKEESEEDCSESECEDDGEEEKEEVSETALNEGAEVYFTRAGWTPAGNDTYQNAKYGVLKIVNGGRGIIIKAKDRKAIESHLHELGFRKNSYEDDYWGNASMGPSAVKITEGQKKTLK